MQTYGWRCDSLGHICFPGCVIWLFTDVSLPVLGLLCWSPAWYFLGYWLLGDCDYRGLLSAPGWQVYKSQVSSGGSLSFPGQPGSCSPFCLCFCFPATHHRFCTTRSFKHISHLHHTLTTSFTSYNLSCYFELNFVKKQVNCVDLPSLLWPKTSWS